MTMLDAVLDRPDPMTAVSRHGASTYRLLVADDQRDVTDALRLLLAGHDFTVHAASSPAEAIAVARTSTLDAALIDLNYEKGRTSGEQGLDLLTALLKHDPLLPVVGMTAWSSMDLVMTALRRGARDVVEKPWDEARLVALLRSQAELGRALKRVSELEGEVQQLRAGLPATASVDGAPVNGMRLLEVEGMLVRRAMERHQGNVSRAARTLGLSRSALYRRLERHKI
jgi:DNA-binding NtrC family response regulator